MEQGRNQKVQLKRDARKQKNAGLRIVTLIAILNPVSQVLW
jgi:hypothetical protein